MLFGTCISCTYIFIAASGRQVRDKSSDNADVASTDSKKKPGNVGKGKRSNEVNPVERSGNAMAVDSLSNQSGSYDNNIANFQSQIVPSVSN